MTGTGNRTSQGWEQRASEVSLGGGQQGNALQELYKPGEAGALFLRAVGVSEELDVRN